MNTKLILTSLSLMLSCATFAHAANAAPAAADAPQITVSYADLNLTNEAGAEHLYRRIEAAAEQVCGPDRRSLGADLRRHSCIEKAVSDAVATVGAPTLTRYHAERTAKSSASATVARQP